MKYKHIIAAFAAELWAIDEAKAVAIAEMLALQASGGKLSAEQLAARIGAARDAAVARQAGAIAILPLRGVIANRMNMMSDISGGTSSEQFAQMFKAAIASPDVKAIVLDVDSPGGVVAGTPELSDMIHAARGQKPIVAQVNALAASAAYWIASSADEVVATPSSEVGGVGVIRQHRNVEKALKAAGVKNTLISSTDSPHKTEGHPFGPLSDETQAVWQQEVDAATDTFVAALARNRDTTDAKVRETYGRGRALDAQRALAAGMIDRIATMDDTLKRFGASLYPSPSSSAAPAARRAFAFEREKRALLV